MAFSFRFAFWGKHYSTWSTKNHFLFCLSGCVSASVCASLCVCVFASACLLLLSSHNLPWLWAALDLWQKRRLNATAALRCHTHTVHMHTHCSHTVHTRSTHTSRTRSSSVSALSPWFFVFVKKCIKPPAINCYSLAVHVCVCQRVSLGRIRLGTHSPAPPLCPTLRVYSANWSVCFSLARSSRHVVPH